MSRRFRHPADLDAAFDAFLAARDEVVPKGDDRERFPELDHCTFNEEFRWRRRLWLALLDATRRDGIWRYRLSDCL